MPAEHLGHWKDLSAEADFMSLSVTVFSFCISLFHLIISCLLFIFWLLFLIQLKSTRSASHILPSIEPDYDNTNSSIFKSRNICRMCSSLQFISNLHINRNQSAQSGKLY